ncbi:MAG: ABC transporter ATP-binding protein [Eubacteriaceae bacterium]|nr:ABC transporter ATP-binding protein [Eubacteriaceae bacterium]
MSELLVFSNYSMGFKENNKVVNLIDNVSFAVSKLAAVGIVGESGCGKSMVSLSAMRLLPANAIIQGGEILLNGEDLLAKSENQMQELRGKQISIIFQQPMSSLNPVLDIGFQMQEALTRHFPGTSKTEADETIALELRGVGIHDPAKTMRAYPHQLSGGMCQRVMIAMATICKPSLLIADEPTTALDTTIQAQVLDLMAQLKQKGSILLVTHNLGVVAEICDVVVVMYAGQVVETGKIEDIFKNPQHPYTQGLLASVPTLTTKKSRLHTIQGSVPAIWDFAKGCRFHTRCAMAKSLCENEKPESCQAGSPGHIVACHVYGGYI